MAQPKLAVWLSLITAVLLLLVALIPIARGSTVDAKFLVLSIVFFVLGVGAGRRNRRTRYPPET